MENPCLTFIIASILESSEFLLIDVVHEIAHGWFGNAVTNATWEEMWLSEGLATYAQRRITSRACGRDHCCHNPVWTSVLDHGLVPDLFNGLDGLAPRLVHGHIDPGLDPRPQASLVPGSRPRSRSWICTLVFFLVLDPGLVLGDQFLQLLLCLPCR